MSHFDHYVFVDFENLPNVDLSPAEGHPVHVSLLVGKNQKKVSVGLLKASRSLGEGFEPIEVGAAGPNALDMTLAYCLGRAIERAPDATFAIVSKDKDFEPLVAHLRANNLRVSRHVSFATLPFLAQPQPAPQKPGTTAKPSTAKAGATPKPKLEDLEKKLVAIWANAPKSRPSTRAKLSALIKNMLGKDASDAWIQSVADRLRVHGHLTIGKEGKITYP